ncbi:hypothetical protein LZG04_29205 [Saccharothrix sp. S26]|uniref:hypothetical protein n=1 Tax=Saccharothrix sp. S26 TaxID=2907215 RepID=UPI001F1FCD1B|nr:hypothetical protein [Saccharothrix sp. S26]MCE6998847.1 hypothetical protein [Saccharothrix sp. S26]
MGAVVWALPVLLGLVLPLGEGGPPVEASLSLVIAGLLLRARQAHAERPGAWFPLLVTGSVLFGVAATDGSAGWWDLMVDPVAFDLARDLVGLAVAVGLGAWAWRVRSPVVAVTALAYLAAVWHSRQPVEDFGWFAYTPVVITGAPVVPVVPFDFPPYPELVVVAGAVLAHTRVDRVRVWHVAAIAGLLGSLVHYGALALVVAAVVIAGYELNARRPGAWYPLLVVGAGLAVWPVVERLAGPRSTRVDPATAADGYYADVTAVAVAHVDHDELFLAFAVAAGLAVWSWRRKSPTVLLTAVAYAGVAWSLTLPEEAALVVLAGAAVAWATTAPGATKTVGRWAGTPGRWPGP